MIDVYAAIGTFAVIHESPKGGRGIDGQALTNADIAAAARRELSSK